MKLYPTWAAWLLCLGCGMAEEWQRLPSLPDAEGFAGSFAGICDGALVVAGGTNFPDKMPWEGGRKTWYDQVHVLRTPDGPWTVAGKLPVPNGYGVSLSTDSGLVIIGGGNAERHYREVFLLSLDAAGQVTTQALPSLPEPCAFMSGAMEGTRIFLCGGIRHPEDTTAMATFWMLDLAALERGWQPLPPCPGPPRILAQMAVVNGAVYLFSGASLKPGPDGKAARTWLKDAWCHTFDRGWERLADAPHVTVAAPSPLVPAADALWILGGDDGLMVDFTPKEKHPGFPRRVLAYDLKTGDWREGGSLPFSLVTTPLVVWRGHWVVAGGEARPGKRSPEVWWQPLPKP
ncbi:MAG: galactose oxidase [Prosthecobacter sp.]|jgi:N-acetylneuraminic acid mutarotase|nr:galactose oxidase [Prosthecobacter sp.]